MTEATAALQRQAIQSSRSSSCTPSHSEYFYAASNTTYCDQDDAICAVCGESWVSVFDGSGKLPSKQGFTCTGASNCICTATCEIRQLGNHTISGDAFEADACANKSVEASVNTARDIGALVLVAFVVVQLVRLGIVTFHQRTCSPAL